MSKSYFSENLRKLRKFKKISLEELAEAINVSKSAISDYENDKFSPSLIICRKIADFFEITIDNLEYSEIFEKNEKNELVIKKQESVSKTLLDAQDSIKLLEKQRNDLMLELKLTKQKVESLQIQQRLQEQLKDSKSSEIELFKMQIRLLEDKMSMIVGKNEK